MQCMSNYLFKQKQIECLLAVRRGVAKIKRKKFIVQKPREKQTKKCKQDRMLGGIVIDLLPKAITQQCKIFFVIFSIKTILQFLKSIY